LNKICKTLIANLYLIIKAYKSLIIFKHYKYGTQSIVNYVIVKFAIWRLQIY